MSYPPQLFALSARQDNAAEMFDRRPFRSGDPADQRILHQNPADQKRGDIDQGDRRTGSIANLLAQLFRREAGHPVCGGRIG